MVQVDEMSQNVTEEFILLLLYASIIDSILVSRGFLNSETTKTTKNQQKLWKHGNLVLGYEDEVGLE